ncbi:MAG: hypothetical protein Q8S13_01035 [Dehalococcoidia bacterium]|nr:hypothetical protein [Dehalococcoidia bacterium]
MKPLILTLTALLMLTAACTIPPDCRIDAAGSDIAGCIIYPDVAVTADLVGTTGLCWQQVEGCLFGCDRPSCATACGSILSGNEKAAFDAALGCTDLRCGGAGQPCYTDPNTGLYIDKAQCWMCRKAYLSAGGACASAGQACGVSFALTPGGSGVVP